MKKVILLLASFLMLVSSLLTGCSNTEENANTGGTENNKIELRFAHVNAETDPYHIGALKFKEEVEKRSNGNITVTIFPNAILGAERDVMEGLQMGTIDMSLQSGMIGNFEPSINLYQMAYLVDSVEEMRKLYDSDVSKEIESRVVENAGVRILGWWDRGPRTLTSNKPVYNLSDLEGLKVRVPEVKHFVEAWKALGTVPTTMAQTEVYTGLEQGVIEAQENAITAAYSLRLYEVQKYYVETNHVYDFICPVIAEKTWQKLDSGQQKIIMEASEATSKYENEYVEGIVNDTKDKMIEGGNMEYIKIDRTELANAVRENMHDEYANSVDSEIWKMIKEVLSR